MQSGREPGRRLSGSRASALVFGPEETRRLSVLHLCQALGDGFFAVSLAGSLFFSVSIDAARPNILAYLLLTMAPFAVLAPLIGPMIDRVAQGYPRVVAGANLVRAALCLLLVLHLRTLLFYPEALGVLVGAKTYSVAKAALVPRLQPRRELLLSTNARLSRMGAVGAATGGATGAGIIALIGAEASVLLAAVAFLTSALLALRLPRADPPAGVVAAEEFEELHDPDVLAAAASVTVLRAATGFLAFFVAFHLKRSGASPWLFGLVAGMSTLAAVSGTVIGPRLRRKYQERTLLRLALVVPAVCCLIGSARIAIGVLIVCVMALGIGGNVGRLAFDSIVQANAPDVDRGRAFARFETRFQLAWVAGAVGPVGLRVPAWAGLLVTSVLLATGALLFGVERSAFARWRRSMLTAPDLPRSVLEQARRLQASGQYAHAVLEAALLLELCPPCCDAPTPTPQGAASPQHRSTGQSTADRTDLEAALHDDTTVSTDEALALLEQAGPDAGAQGLAAATATLREQRDLALAGQAGPREAQRAVKAAAVLHAFSVLRRAPRSTSRPTP